MPSFSHTALLNTLVFALLMNCAHVDTQSKPRLVPYSIPDNRALKKSLGYQEDTYLNFTELATKYGYASEQHSVTTEDGYILTVFRLLPKCSAVEVRYHPVLMMHGIMDSSDLWIIPGTKEGLGYVLSANCYDVWAANHRGNRYSRNHVRLNPDTDAEFWNYSFDEHGNYDLPALIDYVLYTSRKPKLYYVGHSQGTTDFYAMASLRPQYNKKVQLSVLLAPVAWLKNIKNPLPLLAAQGTDAIRAFLQAVGYNEILAKNQIIHNVFEYLCQRYPDAICGELLTVSTGYKRGTIRSEVLRVSFGHLLVGLSVKELTHFGQLILSKKFRRYDEGREGNIKRYGKPNPPNYNVSLITSPMVLINAKNDQISTIEDSRIMESRLPNLVESYIVPEKYWSHHNHVFGIKAPTFVYPKIINYFNKFDVRYHD